MAKYIVSYENDITTHELVFMGESFKYSMIPTNYGYKSDAKCFEVQIQKRFGELPKEITDAADDVTLLSEDDVKDALSILTHYEQARG